MKKNNPIPINPPFFYGWIIVFLAAMAVFFSGPGQTYSISIFIDAYLDHFGWSSTLVSTMYLFATMFAGFLLFIIGRLVDQFGWQVSWLVWSGLLMFFFVPLAFIFIRNKPENVGLLPDNLPTKEVSSNKEKENSTIYEEVWTVKEAMKTKEFWLLLFCVAVPSMVNTGIIFHFVPILAESGIERTQAAFILSIMAMVSFPITFLAGFIVERVKVNYVLALTFAGQIGIMVMLVYTESYTAAILFGIARGIVGGFEVISLGIVWPNYFGRANIGSIKGVSSTIMVIGSAFGPLPFALAYDYFGSYQEIIYLMMIFPLVAMIFAGLSKKPVKDKYHLQNKAV